MITIDNILFISLGGILGYFLRLFLEHFLAKSRTREDRKAAQFMNASSTFRTTLIRELTGVYPEFTDNICDVPSKLQDALPELQVAVSVFSFYLNESQSKEFLSAFEAFRNVSQNDIPRFCSTAERMFTEGSVAKAKAILNEHINALLKFAA